MSRIRKALLPALLLLSLSIGAATLTRGHEWGDDFAWYILQTKSILNGSLTEFMAQSVFANTQSTMHLGPLAYPWGYPLVLIPAYLLKGIHPLALKIPGLILYIGFLICLYFLIKPRLTRTESLLFVSLFAFNPLLIRFLDQILSDIPFLFFSTLALLLMAQNTRRSLLQNILIGAAIFMTAFLRATGIFLLGALLIVEFFNLLENRKDYSVVKKIVFDTFMVCFVFALLWGTSLVIFPSGGESYLSQYANLSLDLVLTNLGLYFNVFSRFFGESSSWVYLYYPLVIFFLLGAWIRRKQESVFIAFFIVWMIVHITYPYWQGPRYIFPLLPIFVYFTFQGMKTTLAKIPVEYQSTGQAVFYSFWILLTGIFLYNSSIFALTNLQSGREINGPFDPYSKEIYQFVKEETSPDSIIVFFKPRVMILMTGHDTIMSTECERVLKGDYLVLSKKVGENQQIPPENIDECKLPLTKALENRRFIVYKVEAIK